MFSLACKMAERGDKAVRRQYRLGAVGIRSDGVIVTSNNVPCRQQQKSAHAEARLARKLNHDSVVFVARILRSGIRVNARPCLNCQKILTRRGITRVYYTISDSEYGVLNL